MLGLASVTSVVTASDVTASVSVADIAEVSAGCDPLIFLAAFFFPFFLGLGSVASVSVAVISVCVSGSFRFFPFLAFLLGLFSVASVSVPEASAALDFPDFPFLLFLSAFLPFFGDFNWFSILFSKF